MCPVVSKPEDKSVRLRFRIAAEIRIRTPNCLRMTRRAPSMTQAGDDAGVSHRYERNPHLFKDGLRTTGPGRRRTYPLPHPGLPTWLPVDSDTGHATPK